jgi:hypothetical protein
LFGSQWIKKKLKFFSIRMFITNGTLIIIHSQMEEFPQSFNFTEYEGLLQNEIDRKTKEEMAIMRQYIYSQLEIGVNENLPYCVIDLKNNKPDIRGALLREVLLRFPTVGYVSDINSKEIFSKNLRFSPFFLPIRIHELYGDYDYKFINRIDDENFTLATKSELFVIACTQKFANEMLTYRF